MQATIGHVQGIAREEPSVSRSRSSDQKTPQSVFPRGIHVYPVSKPDYCTGSNSE